MMLLPPMTSTGAGNGTLQGVHGLGVNTPASCSTNVLTSPREGSTAGAIPFNTSLGSTSFPCFDGTNPRLWRTQCLEYFNRFNIHKCMWVVAARMHMDGKAKEWFEAYRLRQVVGAWPEFINDVEAHFGVGDPPPSTPILGVASPSVVVQATGNISPAPPTRCLTVHSKEATDTAVEPTEPTIAQLAQRRKFQIAQVDLAPDRLGDGSPMAETLTHVGGVSLFLEPCVEPAGVVFSGLHPLEFEDDVFTIVGGLSLFWEKPMNSIKEPEGVTDTSIGLGHVASGVQLLYCILLPQEANNSDMLTFRDPGTQGDTTHDLFLLTCATNSVNLSSPWDPGKQEMTYIGPNGYIKLAILWAPMKWRKTIRAGSWGRSDYHKGNVLAYYTHWGGLLLLKFGEWISINSNADATKLQSPVGNLLVFSTHWSIETIDMVWFQLVHKEPSIMSEFWSWYLQIEGLCKYMNLFPFSGMSSDLEYKQYKQWDPGISEKVLECFSNQDQQTLTARTQVCTKYLDAVLRSCDLTEPLLGGKQCFLGAVMSRPHMLMDWALPPWAFGQLCLDRYGCAYRPEELHRKRGSNRKELNQSRSASSVSLVLSESSPSSWCSCSPQAT